MDAKITITLTVRDFDAEEDDGDGDIPTFNDFKKHVEDQGVEELLEEFDFSEAHITVTKITEAPTTQASEK